MTHTKVWGVAWTSVTRSSWGCPREDAHPAVSRRRGSAEGLGGPQLSGEGGLSPSFLAKLRKASMTICLNPPLSET